MVREAAEEEEEDEAQAGKEEGVVQAALTAVRAVVVVVVVLVVVVHIVALRPLQHARHPWQDHNLRSEQSLLRWQRHRSAERSCWRLYEHR